MNKNQSDSRPYSNPYIAGFILGLVLLASYLILGAGLGASSGMARIGAYLEQAVAPSHTLSSEYFGQWGNRPLYYYLVYMAGGIIIGGFFSAILNKRITPMLEKGKAFPGDRRILFAAIGGLLVGFASRLAGGCTSGQGLSGGALLLTGSLVFLICLFAGGYSSAYFFRRQWHD
jgi:uncharacterized membrane protein YedE/YeeE